MSIGSLGIIGGISATPQAQRNASADRTTTDHIRQQNAVASDQSAVDAAGIGKADGEDHAVGERDADGRLDWQHHGNQSEEKSSDAAITDDASELVKSRDITGDCGGTLDLQG